ncbi:MAG: DUF5723 family protein [Candidatus Marinimicrobia bacterium]|nr:DUF5723 family protein [Candidatus Neomarinimicrobiota bacterium]MCF7851133.1 DUF5723 family protein [Candidatus Neomarinimicrobiota bacterium]MCF7904050.1 DUF5723 family protein [Candidatus Neomarinimicrobiota bacterium]
MRRPLVHIVLSLILFSTSWAQVHIDARGLGLCNAYTVTSRGISAVGYNPANLGFTDEVSFSADIFDFKLTAYNNFMSLALFNQYFTGDRNGDPIDLEEQMPGQDKTHKEYLLGQIPEDGFAVGLGMTVPLPLLNISYGNYAFSSSIEYFQNNSLPKGLFEMVLEGNAVGKSLDLSIKQDLLLVTNMGFSFAIPFEGFHLGATVKYLMGLGFAGVDSSGGSFSTKATGLASDGFYRYTSAIGGNGLAVDIGVTSERIGNLQYGVAINNIIGFINWGNDQNFIAKNIALLESMVPVRRMFQIPEDSSIFSQSTMYFMEMDEVNVTGALSNTDSLFQVEEKPVPVPDGIQMNYPAILRIGASYKYEEDFVVMADLSAGLDDYYFADRKWRLALAAEWIRFKMIPIRSGIAFGGFYGREASIGIGGHLLWFDADIALKFLGGMSFTGAEGIELGVNFKFKK